MFTITVEEFVSLCVEPCVVSVHLWDVKSEKEIGCFSGDEIPDEYKDEVVCSFDSPNSYDELTLNISIDDDDDE